LKECDYDTHIEEDAISGTYKTHKRDEKAYKTLVGKLEKRKPFEGLCV
jgi:hypothetical protein